MTTETSVTAWLNATEATPKAVERSSKRPIPDAYPIRRYSMPMNG
jgi:hypothetical protein